MYCIHPVTLDKKQEKMNCNVIFVLKTTIQYSTYNLFFWLMKFKEFELRHCSTLQKYKVYYVTNENFVVLKKLTNNLEPTIS